MDRLKHPATLLPAIVLPLLLLAGFAEAASQQTMPKQMLPSFIKDYVDRVPGERVNFTPQDIHNIARERIRDEKFSQKFLGSRKSDASVVRGTTGSDIALQRDADRIYYYKYNKKIAGGLPLPNKTAFFGSQNFTAKPRDGSKIALAKNLEAGSLGTNVTNLSVNLVSPPNNSILNSTVVDFSFYATANSPGENYVCRLSTNTTGLHYVGILPDNYPIHITTIIQNGAHSWNATCYDHYPNVRISVQSFNQTNLSCNFDTHTCELSNASVQLGFVRQSGDGSGTGGSLTLFEGQERDIGNGIAVNATYINPQGWYCNETVSCDGYNRYAELQVRTPYYSGDYWGGNGDVLDFPDNTTRAGFSETRTFTVDAPPVNITILSPANNTVVQLGMNATIPFSMRINGGLNYSEFDCYSYISNGYYGIGYAHLGEVAENQTFAANYSPSDWGVWWPGNYSWDVRCGEYYPEGIGRNDIVSENRTLTVEPMKINVTLISPANNSQTYDVPVNVTIVATSGSPGRNYSCYIKTYDVIFFGWWFGEVADGLPFTSQFYIYPKDNIYAGDYNWSVFCEGYAPQQYYASGESETRVLTQLREFNVSANSPADGSVLDTPFAELNYSFHDNHPNASQFDYSCADYVSSINWTSEGPVWILEASTWHNLTYSQRNVSTAYPLQNGDYVWGAYCGKKNFDENGNEYLTPTDWKGNHFFSIRAPPNITLLAPENGAVLNRSGSDLSFRVVPNDPEPYSCDVQLNYTPFPVGNVTPPQPAQSPCIHKPHGSNSTNETVSTDLCWDTISGNATFTYMGNFSEGNYSWQANCVQPFEESVPNGGGSVEALQSYSETRNFSVDLVNFNVTLLHPHDGETFNTTYNGDYVFVQYVAGGGGTGTRYDCAMFENGVEINRQYDILDGLPSGSQPYLQRGQHEIQVACFGKNADWLAPEATSPAAHITVNSLPLGVSLTSPANNSAFASRQVTLNYSLATNDTGASSYDCKLSVDGHVVKNSAGLFRVSNVSYSGNFTNGAHNWSAACVGTGSSQGRSGQSETHSFIVAEPVKITLLTPNDILFRTYNVTLNFTVSGNDPGNLSNCTVSTYDYGNEVKLNMQINYSTPQIQNVNLIRYNALHYWGVSCENPGFAPTISDRRPFIVSAPMNVSLVSPSNNTMTNSSETYLAYNVIGVDLGYFHHCKIFYNGGWKDEETVKHPGGQVTIRSMWFAGRRPWQVQCDEYSILGYSTGRSFASEIRYINVTRKLDVAIFYPQNNSALDSPLVNVSYALADNAPVAQPSYHCSESLGGASPRNVVLAHGQTASSLYELANGNYSLNVTCNDSAWAGGTSGIDFTVAVPPKITLVAPANGNVSNDSLVPFSYRLEANGNATHSCILTVIDTANGEVLTYASDNLADNSQVSYPYRLRPGKYAWSVGCKGEDGTQARSEDRQFEITHGPINVSLISPPEKFASASRQVDFAYAVFGDDPAGAYDCRGYVDGAGAHLARGIVDNSQKAFNLTIQNGAHSWKVSCTGSGSAAGRSGESETRNFTVNTLPVPGFSNLAPADGHVSNHTGVRLSYSILSSDAAAAYDCGVYVGGSLKKTDYNITNSSKPLYNDYYPNGNYSWQVKCATAGGTGTNGTGGAGGGGSNGGSGGSANTSGFASEIRNFTVQSPPGAPLTVILRAPKNGTKYFSSSAAVNLSYTVTGTSASGIYDCTIIANGAAINVSRGLTDNVIVNYAWQAPTGNYVWGVACNGTGTATGRSGSSSQWNFSVGSPIGVYPIAPAYGKTFNGAAGASFVPVAINYSVDGSQQGAIYNCTLAADGKNVGSALLSDGGVAAYSGNFAHGTHSWFVSCIGIGNASGRPGISQAMPFSVYLPANVSLVSPADGYQTRTTQPNFIFSLASPIPNGTYDCYLLVNGTTAKSYANITPGTYSHRGAFTQGDYGWSAVCYGNGVATGSRSSSETRKFTMLSNQAISVSLLSPADGYSTHNKSAAFSYSVNGNESNATYDCGIYLNGTLNGTTAGLRDGNVSTFAVQFNNYGNYSWKVMCIGMGSAEGRSGTSQERLLRIAPLPAINVQLSSPAANYSSKYGNVTFTYSPASREAGSTFACDLRADGAVIDAGRIVAEGATAQFSAQFGIGVHYWNVSCAGQGAIAGTSGASETRQFNITEWQPATVTLAGMADGFVTNIPDENLSYGVSGNDPAATYGCSLFVDGQPVDSREGLADNAVVSYAGRFAIGQHEWHAQCSAYGSNRNDSSGIRHFTVSATAPINITLAQPQNGSTWAVDGSGTYPSGTVRFIYSPQYPFWTGYYNCSLFIDGEFAGRAENIYGGNGVTYDAALSAGQHYWNAICQNQTASAVSATYGFNVVVSQGLQVALDSPLNDAEVQAELPAYAPVNLSYSANSSEGAVPLSCSLSMDGNLLETYSGVSPYSRQVQVNAAVGQHAWRADCNSSLYARSANGSFAVLRQPYSISMSPINSTRFVANSTGTAVLNLSYYIQYPNMQQNYACTLFADSQPQNVSFFQGMYEQTVQLQSALGAHQWHVSCTRSGDAARATSLTLHYYVDAPPVAPPSPKTAIADDGAEDNA